MSVSLYRKYRPVTFDDVVGQDHVTKTLTNAIRQDRVSHAYLFAGPRGTGKTSTAKILAMALNCESGDGGATPRPDGTCAHCEAIRRGGFMDVFEIDAASNRGIDEIRDIRDRVQFAPVEGRMKVYIVDEVHMLTPEAFNALLKMLEEPPPHVVFVLATTEPHKVLPTILSRCQRFDFRRPSVQEITAVLAQVADREDIRIAESTLGVIARAAGGSFRDALGIMDQLSSYCEGSISINDALAILGVAEQDLLFEVVDIVDAMDTPAALLFVERLSQQGADLNQFMRDLLTHLRDLYVTQHTIDPPAGIAASEEHLDQLRSQANRVSTSHVIGLIDLLSEAQRAVRQGGDPRLELELLLIKLTRPDTDSTVRGLQQRLEAIETALNREAQPGPQVPAPSASGSRSSQTPPAPPAAAVSGSSAPPAESADEPDGAGLSMDSEDRPEGATVPPRAPSRGQSREPSGRAAEAPTDTPATTTSPRTGAGAEPGSETAEVDRPRQKPSQQSAPKGARIEADIEHLRRAWPIVLNAVKTKRKGALHAVLSEGRPDDLSDGTLVIAFPAGMAFQAGQLERPENRGFLTQVLLELTGRELNVRSRVAGGRLREEEADEEGARILTQDDLLNALKQQFDARVIEEDDEGS